MRTVILLHFLIILIMPVCTSTEKECTCGNLPICYPDHQRKSVDNYNAGLEKRQHNLIKKLKHEEEQFARKLMQRNSFAYVGYKKQALSYDFIVQFIEFDRITTSEKKESTKNPIIDNLKGFEGFVQAKKVAKPSQLQQPAAEPDLQYKIKYNVYEPTHSDRSNNRSNRQKVC